jgi:tRNA pseudouridine38-40 synthase
VAAPDLRRYSLRIQYDGTDFQGWQAQPGARTVQGELEAVLARLTGTRQVVLGSGRTDRGVHALGQMASVEISGRWSASRLRTALNALLSGEVRVCEVRRVPSEFHARYDAESRWYEYRIGTGQDAGGPFLRRWCWDVSLDPPDLSLLLEAASLISGERSFRKFAKSGQPERGERCHVFEAGWSTWEEAGLRFTVAADRYLHHMVRYLVGSMVAVARGRRALSDFAELLTDPSTALVTSPPAPPEGLFLARVQYPDDRLGNDPDRDPYPGSERTR